MLRVVAHKSAAAADRYYSKGLKREDYYTEGQEVAGKWYGKAAARLGLAGKVAQKDFTAMVKNRHPETGKQLTPRMKADRIIGYDINFHCPKGLSLLYSLTQDKEILGAFRQAVAETMAEIEQQAFTRVRRGGKQENRLTSNLAWAEFIHFTARPIGGIPDPHLHIHCFTFNSTFDEVEGRWKAAKFRAIKEDAPYFQAVFHARLAMALAELGYCIDRTKPGWDISDIPKSAIAKFSRRSAQIDRMAAEMGITDPKVKDALGALSREGKLKGLTFSDLMAAWGARMTPEEKSQIFKVYDRDTKMDRKITAEEAIEYACEKCFDKRSVAPKKTVLAEALHYGVGHVTPAQIERAFNKRGMIVREVGEETLCTTVDVLAEELALIHFVTKGRASRAPLAPRGYKVTDSKLSGEQAAAIEHILNSTDQVIGIRGAAGVGKTTAMQVVVPEIEKLGKKVFAFAPSADASRDTLVKAGFSNAQTVAHLLANPKLQLQTKGQVIWIDEVGQVGVRDLLKITEIAGKETLIIVTGDARQHAPVPRGDAFRLLQEKGGMRVVEITKIRRQERLEYREAVADLSKGNLRTAFQKLDAMGAIIEIGNDAERYQRLASDYLMMGRDGKPPLVLSPTHGEGEKVTQAIRSAKCKEGLLGRERQFTKYLDLRWENVDKTIPENYEPGQVVQYHQNAKGIIRGGVFKVTDVDKSGVHVVSATGKELLLSLKDAAKFNVYEEKSISIGRGDLIRVTKNGKSADGRRINNGNIFRVDGFNKKGEIQLHTGGVLQADYGHFTYGYCQTSHSSQSKTSRDVLIAQSEKSFVASSREQFYVSVSRGKQRIFIYTDSRQGLQKAVGTSSTRLSGIELAQLSNERISSLMSEAGAVKWQQVLERGRGKGEHTSFIERLDHERRQSGLKKGETINWESYIQMRRNLVGPDGKSRSKGHPQPPKQKLTAAGGLTKKVEFPDNLRKQKAAKPQPTKSEKPSVKERRFEKMRSNLKAARSNLKNIFDEHRTKFNLKPRQPKPSNDAFKGWRPTRKDEFQVAERKTRQRKIVPSQENKKQVKVQAPPPPRRGK